MFGGFPSRLAGLLAVLALSPEKSCGFSLRTEPSPLSNRRRHGKTTHRRGREGRGAVFASPGEDAQFLSEGEMAKVWEPQRFEEAIYKWWEESGFFSPDGQTRRQETFFSPKKKTELKNKKPFVCPMPPPNVTGRLHMGHAMFVALEDIMCRFQRMTGAPTLWLPGTDHAGIATQMLVERQLVSEGTSRVALGRGAFLERVWEWKESYGGQIVLQMKRLGAGADWKRERFTLEQDLNQAVVEAFVRLYERGLIYKGSYLVNWSPSLQTAVSDLEVEYSEEKGTLFHFKYPVEGGGPEDFIPVATTRPETIVGDTAVCVHPEDPRYKHLIGKRVVVPMSEGNRGIPVIGDDYVDREFGTGALKVTPGHDPNDWKLGQKHSLEVMNVMNKDGTMNENAGRYASMDRFECRKKIWNDMETAGLTIKTEEIDQRVPRSQRGGEVIEPLVSEQWFLKTGNMGRRGLEAVEEGKLKILPQRFEKVWNNWLSDLRDWCISRQLWWGHQIPVWYLEDPQSEEERRASFCARSEDEALEEARKATGRSDLRLRRDPDVLDTWFSSGLWPFATVGWPDEGAEDFAKFYPASVLETGYDILFFWVARMVMMGLELTDRVPFHTIFLHGLVRDGEGQKMSKTKGNVIDPLEVAGSFGADALRFSLVIGGTPGQDVPLAMDKVKGNRNFANKIWNVGRFVASQFEGISEEERGKVAEEKEKLAEEGADFGSLPLADRFILSKCHGAIEEVSASLGTLDVSSAGKRVYEFFWDEFSEWYIGSASTRLQGQEGPEKRDAARKVLLYGCERALRLVHPFMPFVSEAVWQRLPRRGGTNSNKDEAPSLMIAEWPDREDGSGRSLLWRDLEAEAQFGALQRTVEAIRSARAEYGLELSKKITKAKVEVAAGEPSLLQTLQAEKNTLSLFARLDNESTEITSADGGGGEGGQSGGASVRLVVDERIQVVLPLAELVDVHKERARLTKQMTLAQKSADALQKRINNPKFVQNANPRVVESTRKEFEELQAQIEKLKESLEQVETLAATTAATS